MPKVLIVDDELEVRQFLSRSLADCGYAIREARDGNEALQCVASEHPDVVITDLLMPVMDGFELALRIRADPDHASTEVIFFTGRASPRQVQAMAETAGVAQVVTKPATIDQVQVAVDLALHRKHPADSLQPTSLSLPETLDDPEDSASGRMKLAVSRESGPGLDCRFQVLFERSLDPMLLLDDSGDCQDANPAALEMLGLDLPLLLKLSIWDLIPAVSLPSAQDLWRQFLSTGRIKGLQRIRHRDGQYRELEVSAVAHLEPGMHLTTWRRHA